MRRRAGTGRIRPSGCPASWQGRRARQAPAARGAYRWPPPQSRASPDSASTMLLSCRDRRPRLPSPDLQGGETGQHEHEADDPETHDDFGLRPSLELEMMMQRRHAKDASARELEGGDLQ